MGAGESVPEDAGEDDFDDVFGEEGTWEGDDDATGSDSELDDEASGEDEGGGGDGTQQLRALPRFGLRVMSVEEGSPAAEGRVVAWGDGRAKTLGGESARGLISFADVILSVNGLECGCNVPSFLEMVRASAQQASEPGTPPRAAALSPRSAADADGRTMRRPAGCLDLEVLEAMTNTLRLVRIRPSRWDGHGLLGMSVVAVRVSDNAADVGDATGDDAGGDGGLGSQPPPGGGDDLPVASRVRLDVLRIEQVVPHGPASLAGLTVLSDFVLGAGRHAFVTSEDLRDFLSDNRGRVVVLHVYSSERVTVRAVPLFVPSGDWGPQDDRRSGLGLAVMSGFMDRVPALPRLPRNEWVVPPHRRIRPAAGRPMSAQKAPVSPREGRRAGAAALPSTAPSAASRSRTRAGGDGDGLRAALRFGEADVEDAPLPPLGGGAGTDLAPSAAGEVAEARSPAVGPGQWDGGSMAMADDKEPEI